jgi:5-methylcytosine-specific restriction endonuclease McrA
MICKLCGRESPSDICTVCSERKAYRSPRCKICKVKITLLNCVRNSSGKKIRICNACNDKYSSDTSLIRRGNPYGKWATYTLRNHKVHGYIVNITHKFLKDLSIKSNTCPICGDKLHYGGGEVRPNTASLDRINNEQTLNEDNVWIICFRCNTAKSDMPIETFNNYISRVYGQLVRNDRSITY